MTSETQTLTGQAARTVSYSYDADHLRLGMVHPSSRIVELAWTARAQLAAVTADGPPPFATYVYDKAGRPKSITHENGVVETKSYSAAGELLGNIHTLGGSTLSGHNYTYDTTSRRTAESFADGTTPAREYGYDPASQVVSATYGGGQADAYAYDPMGNRQTATLASQGGASLTYTANSVNQYTSISAQPAPVYDSNGNLTQQNGNSYTWDSENRLLSVVPNTPATGDQSLQYRYDAHHRRVTRTIQEWTGTAWTSTGTTHFIYDGWNVIEEYQITSSTSTLAKTFTWGLDLSGSLQGAGGVGALLMAEEVSGSTTTAYHYHYDGNGNVTEITDAAGSQAASYRYDAFGNALVAAGPYAAANRYRFSTKPLDAEVAYAPLYYYGYRWFDPATGRWPSRDLIQESGGMNLYGFIENKSIDQADVLGLSGWDWLTYIPVVGTIYGMVHVFPGEAPSDYSGGINCASCEGDPVLENAEILACEKKISDQLARFILDYVSSNIPKFGLDIVGAGLGLLAPPAGWSVTGVLAVDAIAGVAVVYNNIGNMQDAAKLAIAKQCHCP